MSPRHNALTDSFKLSLKTAAVTSLTLIGAAAYAPVLLAQAPLAGGLAGRSVEAHAFHQKVSNDYGDWTGVYLRGVFPGTKQTFFTDVLALRGFREEGFQGGIAHRYDWSDRWFHLAGVNAGDGSPLFPRYRADALIGRRWGASRTIQTVAGASVVQSVEELKDVAALGAITWYAPRGFVLESGVRFNTSSPGSVKSHRVHGIAMYTPSSRRSFSVRGIAGTEGWQIVGAGTTLTQFSSQELSLAWRERIESKTAINLQLDGYRNPFYTRSGVTLGVARYW